MLNKCKGRNKKNLPCGLPSLPGDNYCAWHTKRPQPPETFESYLLRVKDKADKLKRKLVFLLQYKEVLLSPHYQKDKNAQDMVLAIKECLDTFRLLMGGK